MLWLFAGILMIPPYLPAAHERNTPAVEKCDGGNSLTDSDISRDLLPSADVHFRGSDPIRLLDFPVDWQQGAPYDKYLPLDKYGNRGAISCVHLAMLLYIRYWSLQTELVTQSKYWYHRYDTGEYLEADFDRHPRWDAMLHSLKGRTYDDAEVDPVARFVFNYCVASRIHWPFTPETEGGAWYFHKDYTEVLRKYFGFNVENFRLIGFAPYVDSGNWNSLYDIIIEELDLGRPVILRLECSTPPGHSVVIVGYNRENTVPEFYIHFGHHDGLSLSETFRLDQVFRGFDIIRDRHVFVGAFPDGANFPRYAKIGEVRNSDYEGWPIYSSTWNGAQNSILFPAGARDQQSLYFVRTTETGAEVSAAVAISPTVGSERKPVHRWNGTDYGFLWERIQSNTCEIYYNRLSGTGGKLLPQDVLVGNGKSGGWRPSSDLAWDGNVFGVVWADDNDNAVRFCRLSKFGDKSNQKFLAKGQDPSICVYPRGFCVAYAEGRHIHYMLLDEWGQPRTTARTVNPQGSHMLFTPKVIWDGSRFAFVWEDVLREGDAAQVGFALVDGYGNLIDGSTRHLTGQDGEMGKAFCPSISFLNDNYHVTCLRGKAYYLLLNTSGEVLTQTDLSLTLWHFPLYVTSHVSDLRMNATYLARYSGPQEPPLVEVEMCSFKILEEIPPTPSATPSNTPTPSPTQTSTPTPSPSPTASASPSPSLTPSPTATPTPTPSPIPTSVPGAYDFSWAWKDGGMMRNHPGVYGTLGVADAANVPGARHSAASWTGPDGGFWLFGGYAQFGPSLWGRGNDLWHYCPASGLWTWVAGAQTPEQAGNYGTQGTPASSTIPGAREHAASWSDATGASWLFGGSGRDAGGAAGILGDLWTFNPTTGHWTWIKGDSVVYPTAVHGTLRQEADANTPGARRGMVNWTDAEGALWLFGGYADDERKILYNDLWKYTPATGNWTWMKGGSIPNQPGAYAVRGVSAPGNTPGARCNAVSWTDSSGVLWLFGGYGYDGEGNQGHLNDLWKYAPATGNWTWMKGDSTRNAPGRYGTQGNFDPANTPGARSNAASWADGAGRLWLLGGYGRADTSAEGYLNDLWNYHAGAGQWVWVKGASTHNQQGCYGTLGVPASANTPGARTFAVSWTDAAGALWLFGGSGRDSVGGFGHLNDLWRGTEPMPWERILDGILGRIAASADMDANTDGLLDAADAVFSVRATPDGAERRQTPRRY